MKNKIVRISVLAVALYASLLWFIVRDRGLITEFVVVLGIGWAGGLIFFPFWDYLKRGVPFCETFRKLLGRLTLHWIPLSAAMLCIGALTPFVLAIPIKDSILLAE